LPDTILEKCRISRGDALDICEQRVRAGKLSPVILFAVSFA
jgi:hypothetical protein